MSANWYGQVSCTNKHELGHKFCSNFICLLGQYYVLDNVILTNPLDVYFGRMNLKSLQKHVLEFKDIPELENTTGCPRMFHAQPCKI